MSNKIKAKVKEALSGAYTVAQIEEMFDAFWIPGRNEWTLAGKNGVDDATKLRQGTFQHGYFGAISGNRLTGNDQEPRQAEKVLIAMKIDQDFPEGSDGGSIVIFLQRPNTEDDANMIPVLELTTQYALFRVPVFGAPINQLPNPIVSSQLFSENGKYLLNMQGDGNLVVYDTNSGAPLWSWMTGPLIYSKISKRSINKIKQNKIIDVVRKHKVPLLPQQMKKSKKGKKK